MGFLSCDATAAYKLASLKILQIQKILMRKHLTVRSVSLCSCEKVYVTEQGVELLAQVERQMARKEREGERETF